MDTKITHLYKLILGSIQAVGTDDRSSDVSKLLAEKRDSAILNPEAETEKISWLE